MESRLLAAVDLRESYTLTPGGDPVADVYETPADLINLILPNLFMFVGVILILYIFGAGFMMVQNPDSSKTTDDAKKRLTYAILGLVLLFASYWIMQIIELYTGISVLG